MKAATRRGPSKTDPAMGPWRGGSAEEVDRPTRDDLVSATDHNLLFSFRICHNHICVTDGLPKDSAFFELLKDLAAEADADGARRVVADRPAAERVSSLER